MFHKCKSLHCFHNLLNSCPQIDCIKALESGGVVIWVGGTPQSADGQYLTAAKGIHSTLQNLHWAFAWDPYISLLCRMTKYLQSYWCFATLLFMAPANTIYQSSLGSFTSRANTFVILYYQGKVCRKCLQTHSWRGAIALRPVQIHPPHYVDKWNISYQAFWAFEFRWAKFIFLVCCIVAENID